MTEADWNNCTDPQKMLEFLRPRITARKLRLFGIACCRHVWHLLRDSRSWHALEMVEVTADDPGARARLQHALAPAREAVEEVFGPLTGLRAELEGLLADDQGACSAVFFVAWRMEEEAFRDTSALFQYTTGRLSAEGKPLNHSDLLRCIFGNPFRRPAAAIKPAWLAWNDGAIRRLAAAIYEERSLPNGTLNNAWLAVLADALEDAGCTDAEFLAHLRSPGPHVRGCFTVDAVLGKS